MGAVVVRTVSVRYSFKKSNNLKRKMYESSNDNRLGQTQKDRQETTVIQTYTIRNKLFNRDRMDEFKSSRRRMRGERTKRRQRYMARQHQPQSDDNSSSSDPPNNSPENNNRQSRKANSDALKAKDKNHKPKDHLYKILVIGDLGAGKTSIIKRYVHNLFSQHYRATIGVDFALKVLKWDEDNTIRLQLWDIGGQERCGNMTRVYYKEAVGAFIVFDVTRVNTFDSVVNWKTDLDSKVQLIDGSQIPCVLLANKCDQQKEGIVNNPTKMDEYVKEKGFLAWYETSAKEGINIDEAARTLIKKILENDALLNIAPKMDKDQFSLTSDSKKKRSCNC